MMGTEDNLRMCDFEGVKMAADDFKLASGILE